MSKHTERHDHTPPPPIDPFTRPGACTRALYREGSRVRGAGTETGAETGTGAGTEGERGREREQGWGGDRGGDERTNTG